MSSVFKKFTAQDFSTTPFNAHKQYRFVSSSASDNSINYYFTSWTSESISLYSSASTNPDNEFDPINAIKYNQLDHLFYKSFKSDISNRLGDVNYLKHRRDLYNKAVILSIPAGLYGHEVKPGSFYISSSNYEIIDDEYGNLMLSGSGADNFPTDVRSNLLRIDPIKGFRAYDLDVHSGYVLKITDPQDPYNVRKRFYRKGDHNPNGPRTYSTQEFKKEKDDSYFFNNFRYNNVTFEESRLGTPSIKFPTIRFNSLTGSNIVIPHNSKYNFNKNDDFSISFYMEPSPLLEKDVNIGDNLEGGIVFSITGSNAYIVYPKVIGGTDTALTNHAINHKNLDGAGFRRIDGFGPIGLLSTNGLVLSDFPSYTGNLIEFGQGQVMTEVMKSSNGSTTVFAGNYAHEIATENGYSDWWIPNRKEMTAISESLDPWNNSLFDFGGAPNNSIYKNKFEENWNDNSAYSVGIAAVSNNLNSVMISEEDTGSPSNLHQRFKVDTGVFPTVGFYKIDSKLSYFFLVRKKALWKSAQSVSSSFDNTKRYIIGKSTTKTIVPTPKEGQSKMFNPGIKGNLQPINAQAEPQFPFEIYMKSGSIYFDRSDGDKTVSINALATSSGFTGNISSPSGSIKTVSHILCQKTGSNLEIYVNGGLKASGSDITDQTQNTANIYIGTKGNISKNDSGENHQVHRFYNGTLNNINIWDKSFNINEIANISSSINASPYIGNMFYHNGFATITHPNYQDIDLPQAPPTYYDLNSYNIKTPATESVFYYKDHSENNSALNGETYSGVSHFAYHATFHPSGSMLFIGSAGSLYKYTLSQSWDITTAHIHSTASLNSGSGLNNTGSNATLVSTVNNTRDLKWSDNGHKLFILRLDSNKPYIDTISSSHEFEITGSKRGYGDWTHTNNFRTYFPNATHNGFNAQEVFFKDGNTFFLVGGNSGSTYTNRPRVDKFIITGSSYDMNTMEYTGDFLNLEPFPSQSEQPRSVSFSDNGKKMFVGSKNPGPHIQEFNLYIPWDITTADLIKTIRYEEMFEAPDHPHGSKGTDGSKRWGIYGFQKIIFAKSSGSMGDYSYNNGFRAYMLTTNATMFQLETAISNPYKLNFQGSHLIYEHEYQCTVDEHEFNDTLNISARKIKSDTSTEVADFTTGSLFKPYVTTVGLYNEDNELLVVGKLGQPIRTSNETDTTFVLRWDT